MLKMCSRFAVIGSMLVLFMSQLLIEQVHAQQSPPNLIAVVFEEGVIPQDIVLPPNVARAAAWGLDIFVGAEVDLVGITGIELGIGIVLDVDTLLDSGIYISVGASGGLNVGAGVGGGIAIGDIEGNTTILDVNVGPGSGVLGVGDDGSVVIGGSYGPGVGGSVTYGPTGTLSVGMVVNAVCWVVSFFF